MPSRMASFCEWIRTLERQRSSRLFLDNVFGVPIRPVDVVPASGALFMLAMRCARTPQRRRELCRRTECRAGRFDPSRQAFGDLLQQPAVAVRVSERRERPVAPTFWVSTLCTLAAEKVVLVFPDIDTGRVMEYFGDLHPIREQLLACRRDIGDDEVETL